MHRKSVIAFMMILCLLLAACGKSGGTGAADPSVYTEPTPTTEDVPFTEPVQEPETAPEKDNQNETMELFFWWTDTYPGTDIVRELEAAVSGTASDGSALQEGNRSETGYTLCDASGREVVSVVTESGNILVLLNDPAGDYQIEITDGLGYMQYNENGVHNVTYTVNQGGELLMSGNTDDSSWQTRFPTGIWGLLLHVSGGEVVQ